MDNLNNRTPNQAKPNQPDNANNRIDDEHAASLAQFVAKEYEINEKLKPEPKHLIPKKLLIYIIASLLISIIGMIILNMVFSDSPATSSSDETLNQLLETTKEVRDIENQ